MASNNDLSTSENILVKVDQNNLIYVDPNSVVDADGAIQPRGLKQENLVMYVNLEADLIPRSILLAVNNQSNTLVNVATGTFNFLKSQSGDGNLDSSWTEAYNPSMPPKDEKGNAQSFSANQFIDQSSQSFGMESITISVKGANFVPQVTINFVDVRGKTLFEDSSTSPYKAFFHLPWPIFYLTVKGYYGKAIKYRLHMTKFTSRFNETNGNFEITTTFVGSTYAFLNDIPLSAIINCPYMFLVEKNVNKTFNEKTGKYEKIVSRSSRGYAILTSIIEQYKQKGLVPKDFPVKTLKELGYIAESLDKVLEKQIFNEVVDATVFQGIKEMEDNLVNFDTAVKAWEITNLSRTEYETIEVSLPKPPGGTTTEFWYYPLGDKTKTEKIIGKDKPTTLEYLIVLYTDKLKKSILFTNSIKNKTQADFKKVSIGSVQDISRYYRIGGDKKVTVGIDNLRSDIFKIMRSFEDERKKLENDVEKRMNEVVKNPTNGFGFEPTIRNIFAIVLANAEVYIRLMKDTHNRAFESAQKRAKLLSGLSTESKGDAIYPWPEVKKPLSGGKQNVIAYPGEPELINKLQSNNKKIWPEIDFIESFIDIATNRLDTNMSKEPSVSDVQYLFEKSKVEDISGIDVINEALPYTERSQPGFVYELYERAKYMTLFDSFSDTMLTSLAEEEYKNIKELISEDIDLVAFTKKLTGIESLINITTSEPVKDSNGNLVKDADGKPITGTIFNGYLPTLSPFDRFNYFRDNLPTVDYLKSVLEESFKLEKYEVGNPVGNLDESKLNTELIKYVPDDYRKDIYPFNSSEYLSYLDKTTFSKENFQFNGILQVDTTQGFICSPINSSSWVNPTYKTNLFDQQFIVGDNKTNVLNTPYFHKQLHSDFSNVSNYGKYAGSSYLLLNSLPFLDLEDEITFVVNGQNNNINGPTQKSVSILMSSLFREIGSTHFVPYHLMLKWGAIYHRYKRYLNDNVDILDGFLNTSNITQPIDGVLFFDNYSGETFTITPKELSSTGATINVVFSGTTDVGVKPYYQAIYHQIVNGYVHYNPSSGNTSYNSETNSNKIIHRVNNPNKVNYWSIFVDNSLYVSGDTYTLLPSNGFLNHSNSDTFQFTEQSNLRTLWYDSSYVVDDFSGQTFSSYSQYPRTLNTGTTYDNTFGIDANYRKVIDLIATFNPQILDSFEYLFLDFASEKGNDEVPFHTFRNLNYSKFQDILSGLTVVKKESTDPTNIDDLIDTLVGKQYNNAIKISDSILDSNNLIKFTLANPKEIDPYIFCGMSEVNPYSRYTVDSFDSADITIPNQNLIKLYIGEDIDGHYINFFSVNNVKLNEENILKYRSIVLIYAGYVKAGGTNTKEGFKTYLYEFMSKSDERLKTFLKTLLTSVRREDGITFDDKSYIIRQFHGYNTSDSKLELYNTFKSFNDKWTAGNSIGQRLLLEEFLFIDKANRDIGDKFYLNIDKIKPLLDPNNAKLGLYGVISLLIKDTGLDMRALPAYVNFYGTNFGNKTKITPSKKVAKNLFGTFLEVDYQESAPKILIQLVGQSSKRLDLNSKQYKFADDSFYIGAVNNNPLIITNLESFAKNDLSKTNKVVAFEVSIGDQNQGIFKGIQLDQSTLKNTSESFVVLENLARSESGAGAYNVDVGLFDYYKQASYRCEVSCLGNVMIQPTMFFYVKNIPMFRGSYWITEVNHSIKGNTITTSFAGSRIPYTSLPDPKDSFVSSYRVLIDKLISRAQSVLKHDSKITGTTTEEPVMFESVSYTTDRGGKKITGEKVIQTVGITEFGVPYNGYLGEKLIQKIENNGQTWLRGIAVQMGGPNYQISDDTTLGIANGIKWSTIKDSTYKFYCTNFLLDRTILAEKIRTGVTTFYNPNGNKKTVTVSPSYQLDTTQTIVANGPVSIGPSSEKYGIGLSKSLMTELGLYDGDVVYFRIN
jgi:hypothetical protein